MASRGVSTIPIFYIDSDGNVYEVPPDELTLTGMSGSNNHDVEESRIRLANVLRNRKQKQQQQQQQQQPNVSTNTHTSSVPATAAGGTNTTTNTTTSVTTSQPMSKQKSSTIKRKSKMTDRNMESTTAVNSICATTTTVPDSTTTAVVEVGTTSSDDDKNLFVPVPVTEWSNHHIATTTTIVENVSDHDEMEEHIISQNSVHAYNTNNHCSNEAEEDDDEEGEDQKPSATSRINDVSEEWESDDDDDDESDDYDGSDNDNDCLSYNDDEYDENSDVETNTRLMTQFHPAPSNTSSGVYHNPNNDEHNFLPGAGRSQMMMESVSQQHRRYATSLIEREQQLRMNQMMARTHIRNLRPNRGNSTKALPSQFVYQPSPADNAAARAIVHHTGSHYHMAGSKQYQRGVRVKGVVSRHSKQGAKLQAARMAQRNMYEAREDARGERTAGAGKHKMKQSKKSKKNKSTKNNNNDNE